MIERVLVFDTLHFVQTTLHSTFVVIDVWQTNIEVGETRVYTKIEILFFVSVSVCRLV